MTPIIAKRALIALTLLLTALFPALPAQAGRGAVLRFRVEAGPGYVQKARVMLLPMEKTPSMAVWLATPDGGHVLTIYVTRRVAAQDWRTGPFTDKTEVRRPEALPIWTAAHQRGGRQNPKQCAACHDQHQGEAIEPAANKDFDAVSGATPQTAFSRTVELPADLPPGRYLARLEVNHSWDYTAAFPEDSQPADAGYNGQSGQPSVLWQGEVSVGGAPSEARLQPVGQGDPAGRGGQIKPGLAGLDSALGIVSAVTVVVLPPTKSAETANNGPGR